MLPYQVVVARRLSKISCSRSIRRKCGAVAGNRADLRVSGLAGSTMTAVRIGDLRSPKGSRADAPLCGTIVRRLRGVQVLPLKARRCRAPIPPQPLPLRNVSNLDDARGGRLLAIAVGPRCGQVKLPNSPDPFTDQDLSRNVFEPHMTKPPSRVPRGSVRP